MNVMLCVSFFLLYSSQCVFKRLKQLVEAKVDMPLGVSEADNRGAGPHFDGFTYQGS